VTLVRGLIIGKSNVSGEAANHCRSLGQPTHHIFNFCKPLKPVPNPSIEIVGMVFCLACILSNVLKMSIPLISMKMLKSPLTKSATTFLEVTLAVRLRLVMVALVKPWLWVGYGLVTTCNQTITYPIEALL
jgi:hypothetical protein